QVNWQSRSSIDDPANLPPSQKRIGQTTHLPTLVGTNWKIIQRRCIECVTHIKSVVAIVGFEIERIALRLGLVRSRGSTNAVSPCPLRTNGQARTETAIDSHLKCIVV